MNEELQKTIAELAEKMGISLEKLWPILVADRRLDNIMGLAASICFMILSAISFAALWRHDEIEEFARMCGVLFSICIFIICLFCVFASISPIIYPEAAVIRSLLSK